MHRRNSFIGSFSSVFMVRCACGGQCNYAARWLIRHAVSWCQLNISFRPSICRWGSVALVELWRHFCVSQPVLCATRAYSLRWRRFSNHFRRIVSFALMLIPRIEFISHCFAECWSEWSFFSNLRKTMINVVALPECLCSGHGAVALERNDRMLTGWRQSRVMLGLTDSLAQWIENHRKFWCEYMLISSNGR